MCYNITYVITAQMRLHTCRINIRHSAPPGCEAGAVHGLCGCGHICIARERAGVCPEPCPVRPREIRGRRFASAQRPFTSPGPWPLIYTHFGLFASAQTIHRVFPPRGVGLFEAKQPPPPAELFCRNCLSDPGRTRPNFAPSTSCRRIWSTNHEPTRFRIIPDGRGYVRRPRTIPPGLATCWWHVPSRARA